MLSFRRLQSLDLSGEVELWDMGEFVQTLPYEVNGVDKLPSSTCLTNTAAQLKCVHILYSVIPRKSYKA